TVLRLDGTLAADFLAAANDQVKALAWQADGKLLVGGAFTQVNGVTRFHVARLNSDGSLDKAFDVTEGADDEVDVISLDPQGRIMIGGKFSILGQFYLPGLARVNSDGTVDESFNPDINGTVINDVLVQPDGKVLVSGDFKFIDGVTREGVA